MDIVFSVGVLDTIRDHCCAAYPEECCGILIGSRGHKDPDSPAGIAVLEARPGRNIRTDRARDQYELDPVDLLRAEQELEEQKDRQVVGFYHSHPDWPAEMSKTDRDQAWPEYLYGVVRVEKGEPKEMGVYTVPEMGGAPEIRKMVSF